MKPLDPRLLRYASAARSFIAALVLLGLGQITAAIAFAWLLAAVVTTVAGRVFGPPISDFPVPFGWDVPVLLAALVTVVLLRSALNWAVEWAAVRTAVKVKSQLRRRSAESVVQARAGYRSEHPNTDDADTADPDEHKDANPLGTAETVTLLGPGLDALDQYFSRYVPQLILTALAIPLFLAVLAIYDATTALVVALTMPLIPIFMILIGWSTQAAQQRQFQRQNRLSTLYLDMVEGLSTLKVFNRQHKQRQNIIQVSEGYRSSMMKVLRVSFLSSFVLELAASLSVALVAVSIGVRLIDGSLGLFVGLFALLIVPEAYAPLRQVGANYHAAAEGVAAAESVFAVIERGRRGQATANTPGGDVAATSAQAESGVSRADADSTALASSVTGNATPASPGAHTAVEIRDLHVYRGNQLIVENFTADIRSGEITTLVGPSGQGKSTLLAALLGFVPSTGSVRVTPTHPEWPPGQSGHVPVADQAAGAALTRENIAWSGQHHGLQAGTIAENLTLGDPDPDLHLAEQILGQLGLGGTRSSGGLGLDDELGVRGQGVSGGQAHRIAVGRAVYRARRRNCLLLVLDEPSAALDADAETQLLSLLQNEAAAQRAVLVVSHRQRLHQAADQVLTLNSLTNSALYASEPSDSQPPTTTSSPTTAEAILSAVTGRPQ